MPSGKSNPFEKSYFQGGNSKASFYNYGGIDKQKGKNLKRKNKKRKK